MKPNPHYREFKPETREEYAVRLAKMREKERCIAALAEKYPEAAHWLSWRLNPHRELYERAMALGGEGAGE